MYQSSRPLIIIYSYADIELSLNSYLPDYHDVWYRHAANSRAQQVLANFLGLFHGASGLDTTGQVASPA